MSDCNMVSTKMFVISDKLNNNLFFLIESFICTADGLKQQQK